MVRKQGSQIAWSKPTSFYSRAKRILFQQSFDELEQKKKILTPLFYPLSGRHTRQTHILIALIYKVSLSGKKKQAFTATTCSMFVYFNTSSIFKTTTTAKKNKTGNHHFVFLCAKTNAFRNLNYMLYIGSHVHTHQTY